MKKLLSLLFCAVSLLVNAQTTPITTPVPARPAGQKDVLRLALPKMKVVRVGCVGVGMRGAYAVDRWCNIDQTEIKGICDVRPEYVEKAQQTLQHHGRPKATSYSGSTEAYKKMCERNDIDLIYICTDWSNMSPLHYMLWSMERT